MDFTPVLDLSSREPLYQQLYEQISRAITSGTIPAGERLPSIRQLVKASGVGKITVEAAYHQLLAEGYILSKERSGFFAAELEVWREQMHEPATLPLPPSPLRGGNKPDPRFNFHGSVVDTRSFPYREWRTCMLEAMETYADDFAFYGDSQGERELRQELAGYLRRARTLHCEPEQILIGTGLQQALSLICLLLADRHRVVAFEEPGYADARVVFSQHGYEVVSVPVEEDGLSIESLEKSGATVVYTTPAHQYPYGMVMPVAKRHRLLQWAKRTGSIIIENDYDGEFRYNVRPTPSLQGMDRDGTVAYIGNFSKALSPALRLDYTVLPAELLQRYFTSFLAYPSPVSRHLQRTMQLFMEKGYWEKHVRKMRTLYHRKHDLLLKAVHTHMPREVRVLGHSVGLHILLEVKTSRSEEELMQQALAAGISVYASGRSWAQPPSYFLPRMIVGFGGVAESDMEEGISLLAGAWFGSNLLT
ncbi:transcriptional regulator [Brevibacillus choshinensis]|uniref:Transcriptional regulator n=1 Tax=Brevibacillus choshinensis TaxID=54911 RepID=A0ABR5N4Z6_BRECH|nr:PLP-dependent aminotransferase family protein [Brevibacillus choshinensis]KQL45712.1 transcriptional regulator [Brevibacillus choshinensis]